MFNDSEVYAVENRLVRWLDLPAPVRVFGSDWYLETEVRFARVEDVQAYVDQAMSHLIAVGSLYEGRAMVPVAVRARRGNRAAHYEVDTHTIAIPPVSIGGTWALREHVVLHELTHHLAGVTGHGSKWRTTFCTLLADLGKPYAATLLRAAFLDFGLDVSSQA